MKKIILSTLLIGISTLGFAEKKPEKITYLPQLKTGESYNYSITTLLKRMEGDKIESLDTIKGKANLELQKESNIDYTFKWVGVNNFLSSIDEETAKRDSIFKKYEEIEIVFSVSKDGKNLELQNWEALKEKTQSLVKEIENYISQNEEPSKDYLTFIEIVKSQFGNKEVFELHALREVNQLCSVMGKEISRADTLKYQETIPNPFDGTPVQVGSKLFLDKKAGSKQDYIVKRQMVVDPQVAKFMMIGMLKAMGATPKDIEEMVEKCQVLVSESDEVTYENINSLPQYSQRKQIVNINLMGKIFKSETITTIEVIGE